MDEKAIKAIFEKAHRLLNDLESSLIFATKNEIGEGRFTAKSGGVTAELQWPYSGFNYGSRADSSFQLRFYLEGRIDPPVAEEPA